MADNKEQATQEQQVNPEAVDSSGTEATREPEILDADDGSQARTPLVERLEQRIQEKDDEILRLRAEFENFKRRNMREREDAIRFANQSLIREMLGVLDAFDLAASHIPDSDEGRAIAEGIDMTRKQLVGVLEKHGLRPIDTSGAFDPSLHEAVLQESSEGHEDNDILAVMQKGYCLHDRVVRPAMVKVCKN